MEIVYNQNMSFEEITKRIKNIEENLLMFLENDADAEVYYSKSHFNYR